jgi:antitoxin component HigA of HigAB toxin-antitoxin module
LFGDQTLSQSDPTDHALAAIASILDHPPESQRELEKPVVEVTPVAPELIDADGYHKVGPGPMEAIRFKWTVRRDSGEYFVDETIGDSSHPVVSGPMSADEAVQLVGDRDREARRRFDQIKNEMAGRAAAISVVRKDGSEM